MTPRSQPLHRRPSRWLTALLVFALLYLQALGQAHRVAHRSFAFDREHAAGPAVLAAPTTARQQAVATGAAVFGHAPQADQCRLFDQLSLGDLTPAGAGDALVPPPAAGAAATAVATRSGTACRAYQARGPPPTAA